MQQIKVDASILADESLTASVLAELQAQGVPAQAENAEVIRDAMGKPVQVRVNLPDDVPGVGIAIANAAIQNHPGVAGTRVLPVEETSDFDALTPNAIVTSFGTGDTKFTITPFGNAVAQSQVYAALAAESVGGTGSALRVSDITSPTGVALNREQVGAWFEPLAIAKVTGYELDISLKLNATDDGNAREDGDYYDVVRLEFPNAVPSQDGVGFPGATLIRGSAGFGGVVPSNYWKASEQIGGNDYWHHDTPTAYTDWLNVKLVVKPDGSVTFDTGNAGQLITYTSSNWFGTYRGARFAVSHFARNASTNIGLIKPVIVDNVRLKITDAQ